MFRVLPLRQALATSRWRCKEMAIRLVIALLQMQRDMYIWWVLESPLHGWSRHPVFWQDWSLKPQTSVCVHVCVCVCVCDGWRVRGWAGAGSRHRIHRNQSPGHGSAGLWKEGMLSLKCWASEEGTRPQRPSKRLYKKSSVKTLTRSRGRGS